MFTATVKGFERFSEVDADVERLCVAALDEAAQTAALTAQGNASIDLRIEITPAQGTFEGFSSGIRSWRQGKNGALLGPIFDEGTLGRKRGKLQRPRAAAWPVNRKGTTYTAHRHEILPVEGHTAERFFPRARNAGRKALLARIDRGV